jgi:hypothetical protein
VTDRSTVNNTILWEAFKHYCLLSTSSFLKTTESFYKHRMSSSFLGQNITFLIAPQQRQNDSQIQKTTRKMTVTRFLDKNVYLSYFPQI